jgi:hypothetical protein
VGTEVGIITFKTQLLSEILPVKLNRPGGRIRDFCNLVGGLPFFYEVCHPNFRRRKPKVELTTNSTHIRQ